MAPCVFLIDGLDKSFSGVGTGGENNASLDRIFGHLLIWLQDMERNGVPVFVFATASHLERIPAELMRLGRFDEKFFFLPTPDECRTIATLHLAKHACMLADVAGAGRGR
ncbi:AAA family ATPase [Collinsella intestinalis]|nr:AAA family ATPase [Collinsella intestinalis]MBM6907699.1 AAA family ATPase [Collinsella intestinalis]